MTNMSPDGLMALLHSKFQHACNRWGLRPQLCPVPVCDAASAVSPACISLFVLSDTHSVPDEAEPQMKEREREQFSFNFSSRKLKLFYSHKKKQKKKNPTWLVKLVIWPWSLSTCRLKSSFSSFIRSLSLLSFLKSSSKILTWNPKQLKATE